MLNLIALAFLLIPSHTIAYEAPKIEIPPTIEQQIENVFGEAADTMISIATCESRLLQFDYDGRVIHGKIHPADTGLFQVNMAVWSDEATKRNIDVNTVEGNIQMAKVIYDTQGLSAWNPSKSCWSRSNYQLDNKDK